MATTAQELDKSKLGAGNSSRCPAQGQDPKALGDLLLLFQEAELETEQLGLKQEPIGVPVLQQEA